MAESMIGELFMRCRHAATAAHAQHLLTDSYAKHMALNEFYDGVVERADAIAEAYIGRSGRFEMPDTPYTPAKDPLVTLRALRGWVDTNRDKVSDAREVQNLIDELLTQIDSAVYKIRFLA